MVDFAGVKSQVASLKSMPESGPAFYKYFFTNYPEMKQLFKGLEDVDPNTIPEDPSFQKPGRNFINMLNQLANLADDQAKFDQMVTNLATRHKKYNVGLAQFQHLYAILSGFLTSLGFTPDPAWADFCSNFNAAAAKA